MQLSSVRISVCPHLASAGGPGTSADVHCTSCTEAVLCTHRLQAAVLENGTPHAGQQEPCAIPARQLLLLQLPAGGCLFHRIGYLGSRCCYAHQGIMGALSDSRCLSDSSAGPTADMQVSGCCKYCLMHCISTATVSN
jgi:hypothetical protein